MSSDKAINEGFAFPSRDGQIMVWYEGLPQPIEVARRGSYNNFVSGLAFHKDTLFDASFNGTVFDTMHNDQVYAAPANHAIHHLESVEDKLIATLGKLNPGKRIEGDYGRDISFVDVFSGEVLGGKYLVKDAEDQGKAFEYQRQITARHTDKGWDILCMMAYSLKEGALKEGGRVSLWEHLLVRGAGKSLFVHSQYPFMPRAQLDIISLPLRQEAEFQIPEALEKVTLAVNIGGRLYLALGSPEKGASDYVYTIDDIAKPEPRKIEVQNFNALGYNNAAVILPRDYINDAGKVQMRSLDIKGDEGSEGNYRQRLEHNLGLLSGHRDITVVVKEGQDLNWIA